MTHSCETPNKIITAEEAFNMLKDEKKRQKYFTITVIMGYIKDAIAKNVTYVDLNECDAVINFTIDVENELKNKYGYKVETKTVGKLFKRKHTIISFDMINK